MILVFLECFVLFGVPAFLGMPAGVYVMSTKIYHLFLANPPDSKWLFPWRPLFL